MTVRSVTLFDTPEWLIVQRTADVGDAYRPTLWSNSQVCEASDDWAPIPGLTTPSVLVFQHIPVIAGRVMELHTAEGLIHTTASDRPFIFGALPLSFCDGTRRGSGYLRFPDGLEWVCCVPKETKLYWRRRLHTLTEGESIELPTASRVRVIVLKGAIQADGAQVQAPAICTAEIATATTDTQCLVVWL